MDLLSERLLTGVTRLEPRPQRFLAHALIDLLADQGIAHALPVVRVVFARASECEGEPVAFDGAIRDHPREPNAATGDRIADSGRGGFEDGLGLLSTHGCSLPGPGWATMPRSPRLRI